jgi:Rrf2 family protein
MKLSTAGKYGVQAMYELANSEGGIPLSGKEIAQRNKISHSYLEQLLVRLRRKGLLRSVRGPGGGYVLAKEPEEITAGEILRALEGPLTLSRCFVEPGGSTASCGREGLCVSKLLVKRLTLEIARTLDQISLADLNAQAMERKSATTGG